MATENTVETDVLVIGGGMAGLFAAIKARDEGVKVTLVDKNYVSRSGMTSYADCHYAVCNPEWGHDPALWKRLIGETGEYMNNPEWSEIAVEESLDRYRDLLSWGIDPPRGEDGELVKFGIRGKIEAVWIGRGYDILPLIRRQAVKAGVNILDRVMVTDFIVQDGQVTGATGFHTRTGDFYIFKARAVVASTGGGNFKPAFVAHLSFDGESMAYRAGLAIVSKEFAVTGHSRSYYIKRTEADRVSLEGRKINTTCVGSLYFSYPPPLIYGKGVDSEGYGGGQFFNSDILALHEGRGPILFDLDPLPAKELKHWIEMYKVGYERLRKVGADPHKRGLWAGISRYEHFVGAAFAGTAGIESTDTQGATALPGLYAAGDAYHSASSGAVYSSGGSGTRNASVTGARAGHSAARYAFQVKAVAPDNQQIARLKSYAYAPLERKGGFDTVWVTQQTQNCTLPYYIFFVRDGERLKGTLAIAEFLNRHIAPKVYARDAHGLRLAHEAKNRLLNAEMMLRSALYRTESRGVHYREDYPRRDDPAWLAWVKVKEKNGQMTVEKTPLPEAWWPDLTKAYTERYPLRYKGAVQIASV
jgi:succinate dehydrogenase/fumarate reductase flavoprotein subunit